MALRDTSWLQDTTGAVQTGNFIVLDNKKLPRKLIFFNSVLTAQITKTTSEAINVTQAAALAFVTNHAFDTNTTYSYQETERINGAYKVTRYIDSHGSWS